MVAYSRSQPAAVRVMTCSWVTNTFGYDCEAEAGGRLR